MDPDVIKVLYGIGISFILFKLIEFLIACPHLELKHLPDYKICRKCGKVFDKMEY